MPDDPIVRRLVERRGELGLSQRAAARRVGTAVSNLHYWESGGHEPTLTSLCTWARALGFEVSLTRVPQGPGGTDG